MEDYEWCENCAHCILANDPDYYVCNNPESDGYGLEVLRDDTCEEFEAREGE